MNLSSDIFVDGVRYISVDHAASTCDLSKDYIGRLAREGKVLGTQVQRRWYISEKSLKEFLLRQNAADEARRLALIEQRRREYAAGLAMASKYIADSVAAAKQTASKARESYAPDHNRFKQTAERAFKTHAGQVLSRAHAVAAQSSSHVPLYAVTPGIDLLHRVVAAVVALVLTVGVAASFDSLHIEASVLAERSNPNEVAAANSSGIFSGTFEAIGADIASFFGQMPFGAAFASVGGRATVVASVEPLVVGSQNPSVLAAALNSQSSSAQEVAGATAPAPERTILQQIVEPQTVAVSGGITEEELDQKLQQLSNKLLSQLYAMAPATPSFSGPSYSTPATTQALALTNAIDQLTNTNITNPTIKGGTISNLSSLDVSGLTSLATTTVSGDLTVNGTLGVQNISLSSTTVTINGTAGQTANFLDIRDASGTVVFAVQPDGTLISNTSSTTQSVSSLLVTGNATATNMVILNEASTSNLVAQNATTTNLAVTGLASLATTTISGDLTLTGSLNFSSSSSTISAATASTTNLVAENATSTNLFASLGTFTDAIASSLSATLANITGLTAVNSTTTNATTTNLAVTNLTSFTSPIAPYFVATSTTASVFPNASTTLLSVFNTAYFGGSATTTIDSSGNIFGAGTLVLSGLGTFQNGFVSQASSTIGNGTQAGGLTVNGGATTTGAAYFAGNVGIGSEPNTASLVTAGNIQSSGGFLAANGSVAFPAFRFNSGTAGIYTPGSNDLAFVTNGIESVRVSSGGNLGIGTTSPTNKLEVNGNTFLGGNLTVTGATNQTALATFAGGLISQASSTIGDGTQGGGLTILGSATTTGNQYVTGKIGIGTNSPAYPLEIAAPVSSYAISLPNDGYIGAKTTGGSLFSILGVNGGNDLVIGSGSGGWNNVHIYSNGSEHETLLANGNLGIGTTSPATNLSVAGSTYTTGGLGVGVLNTVPGTLKTTGDANIGGALTLGTPLTQGNGGTGFTTYTAGDILYADGSGNLQKLPIGATGNVLLVQAGLPAWGAASGLGGGGASDQLWATSTDSLVIFPSDSSRTVVVGGTATSTLNSVFEVHGQQYISTKLGIGTTTPFASLSVNGNASIGNFYMDNTVACGNAFHAFFGPVGSVGGDECAALNVTQQDSNGNVIYRFGPAGGAWAGEFYSSTTTVALNTKSLVPIEFQIEGSEIARVDSSGNFGIGTTSPTSKLEVNGNTLLGGNLTVTGTTKQSALATFAAGFISQASSTIGDGTQAGGLTVNGGATTTGNAYFAGALGVGISNPTFSSISSGIVVNDTTDVNHSSGIQFDTLGTSRGAIYGNPSYIGITAAGNQSFRFVNGGTERFRVDGNTGNFGIGTTSPWKMFSVAGDIIGTNITATGTIAAAGITNTGLFSTGNASTSLLSVFQKAYFGGTATTTIDSAGNLSVAGNLSAGPSSAFYVDSSTGTTSIANLSLGNLTFDTDAGVVALSNIPVSSSPAAGTIDSQSIEIGDTPFFTAYAENNGAGGVQNLRAGVGSTTPNSTFVVQNTYGNKESLLFTIASSTASDNSNASSIFTVGTNGNAYLSGNLGIGTTTPNANINIYSSSPVFALDNSNATSLNFLQFNENSVLKAFIKQRGSSNAGNPNQLQIGTNVSGGSIALQTGAANTALTIDSSGNLGIGTTSPTALLALQANNGTNYPNNTLFTIASSTASATTTLFNLSNTGQLVLNADSSLNNSSLRLLDLQVNGTSKFNVNGAGDVQNLRNIYPTGSIFLTSNGVLGWNTPDVGISRTGSGKIGIGNGTQGDTSGTLIAGTIGIGTTTPAAKLNISGTTEGVNAFQIDRSDSPGTALLSILPSQYAQSLATPGSLIWSFNRQLAFNAASTIGAQMVLTQSGNIGIGTTSPTGLLALQANNGSTYPNNTLFTIASSTASATTTLFTIQNTGNVGIGGAPYSNLSTLASTAGIISFGGSGSTGSAIAFNNSGAYISNNGGSNQLLNFNIPNSTGAGFNFLIGTGINGLSGTNALTINQFGNVGIGTTTPWAKLSLAALSGNTAPLFALSTSTASATSTAFIIDQNGLVGIGTTTPFAQLAVAGTAAASNLNIFNTAATSTISGGLTVGNGALNYDFSSGIVSAQNLTLGALSFDTDAGQVSWADLPVTSNSTAGTIESYTAQIGGTPVLTSYAESNGAGGVQNLRAGVGTTTPGSTFAVQNTYGNKESLLFVVASSTASDNSTASNIFTLGTNGNAYLSGSFGIGTTSPWKMLSVAGDIIGTNITATGTLSVAGLSNFTGGLTSYASSTIGNGTQTGGLTVSGGATTTGTAYFATQITGPDNSTWNSGGLNGPSGGNLVLTPSSGNAVRIQGWAFNTNFWYNSSAAGPQLQAAGAGTTSPTLIPNRSSTNTGIGGDTNSLAFITNGTAAQVITSTGNVGIGTSTPGAKLDVQGGSSDNATFSLTNNATNAWKFWNDNGASNLNLQYNGSTKLLVQNSGNVGIGTTSPTSILAVSQTTASPQVTVAYDNTHTYQARVDSAGGYNEHASGNNIYAVNDNVWVCTGGSITTNACPSGTPSGQGNLIVANNVGIGTTSPAIDANTSRFLTLDGGSSNNGEIAVGRSQTSTSGAVGGFDFFNSNLGSEKRIAAIWSSTDGATNSGNIQFYTASGGTLAEQMRLTSGGKLGIGTTTPTQQLSVQGLLQVGANSNAPVTMGTATSTFNGDVKILGKLDVATIDPVYTIDSTKYATYGESSVGIHEETMQTIELTEKDPATGKYTYAIDFDSLDKGSDLWLFYQITDFGEDWSKLVVQLTPSFDGVAFYKKVPGKHELLVEADQPGEVSMRLTGDRFDFSKWGNLRPDQNDKTEPGFILTEKAAVSPVQSATSETPAAQSAAIGSVTQ